MKDKSLEVPFVFVSKLVEMVEPPKKSVFTIVAIVVLVPNALLPSIVQDYVKTRVYYAVINHWCSESSIVCAVWTCKGKIACLALLAFS
jgi:hypothetical protein